MKKTTFVIKIIITSLLTILLCMTLLFASSMIPQKSIQKNSIKSAEYYMKHDLFFYKIDDCFFSRQDNYADCILSNIIYHIDSSHPIISTLRASYYQPDIENVNDSFQRAVQETVAPNVDYYRYWHGSMILIRPLLLFMDITGVRLVLGIAAIILSLTAAVLLWIKKEKVLAVVYGIGICLVDIWMTCFCIEYVTTFLVMGVVSILMIVKASKITKKEEIDKQSIPLFLCSGIVTAFVDFLTTETITYTIPFLILFIMLYQKNLIENIRKALKILLKNGIAWVIGYGGMFLLKWIISAACFGTEALKSSFEQAAVRLGGNVNLGFTNLSPTATLSQRLAGALWHNLGCLFHFKGNMSSGMTILVAAAVLLVVFSLVYLFHHEKISLVLYLPLGILALLPYIRYLVLSNHAYLHYFFTYRAQLITIIVLLYFVWENAAPGIGMLLGKKRKSHR